MPRNFGYNHFDNRKQFERLNNREHDTNGKSEIRIRIEYRKKAQIKDIQRFTGVLIPSMKREEAFSSRKGRGSIFSRTAVSDLIARRKSYEKDINKYIGKNSTPEHLQSKYFKLIENVEYSEKQTLAEINMKGPLQDISLDPHKEKLQKDIRAFEALLSNLEGHAPYETPQVAIRETFEQELQYSLGLEIERPENKLNKMKYEQKYINNKINNLINELVEMQDKYKIDSKFSMISLSNQLERFHQAARITRHAWSLEFTKIKAHLFLDKNGTSHFKDAFDTFDPIDDKIKIWNRIWAESTTNEKTKLNELIGSSRETNEPARSSHNMMDGPNLLHFPHAINTMKKMQRSVTARWDNITKEIKNDIEKIQKLCDTLQDDFRIKNQMIKLVDNYLDQKRSLNPEPMERLSCRSIGDLRKELAAFRKQEDSITKAKALSERFNHIVNEYNFKEKLDTSEIDKNIGHEYLEGINKIAMGGVYELNSWYNDFEHNFQEIKSEYQSSRHSIVKSIRSVIRRIDKSTGENITREKLYRGRGLAIRRLFGEEVEESEQDYDLESVRTKSWSR